MNFINNMRAQSDRAKHRFALSVALGVTAFILIFWAVSFSVKMDELSNGPSDKSTSTFGAVKSNMASVVSGFEGLKSTLSSLFSSGTPAPKGELEPAPSNFTNQNK
ncbi:MAG: hypothetical protein NTV72_02000 [Candidatus Taylorbacteria bacterium]|nr:hypothetical protein [Candidatus Taylorbacteria bacterium]